MRLLVFFSLLLLCPVCTSEHECQVCEPNTYCYVERQHQCPQHSAAPSGSDDVSDCVCHAGFYLHPDEPLCVECEENHYCPGGPTQLRMLCPINTESGKRATHDTMCVCSPGFTHDGVACVACTAGTIKPTTGNSACQPCPVDHYSISSVMCSVCPALTQSKEGAASLQECVAQKGAFKDFSDSAHLCPRGTFQDKVNQTSCNICPANTYQPKEGATAKEDCLTCPLNSGAEASSSALTNCTCLQGYTGQDGGPCSKCVAGTFKLTEGSAACEQCPRDTYAGAGSSACAACPVDSFSAAGSTVLANCTCAAGFGAAFEPFACAACAPGSAKLAGNSQCVACTAGLFADRSAMQACVTCPADTYSSLGSAACQACAANEFSAPGSDSSDDCLCDAGYYRRDTACAKCAIGFFRNTSHALSGSAECVACPAGYSTQSAATVSQSDCYLCPADNYVLSTGSGNECVQCGANAQSNAGTVDGCLCDAGFERTDAVCAPCEYGYHKHLPGNHSCTACAAGQQGILNHPEVAALGASGACEPCPADTYWSAAGAPCAPCPANSHAPEGSTSADQCLCHAGYELRPQTVGSVVHMACAPCTAGYAKPGVSNVAFCTPCSGMHYSHSAAAASCEICPPNSYGGTANDADVDCECQAAFTGPHGGPCIACELGKYKPSRGSAACLDCGSHAFWPLDADPSMSHCEACPGNSTRGDDLSSGVLGCVCDKGYKRTSDAECVLCEAGSYCTEQHIMQQCPPHSFSAPGSASIDDCKCTAGFYGASGNCSTCPVDTFCLSDAFEPALCLANSSTVGLTGQTNISACVCIPGFYRSTDQLGMETCRQCEPDNFCFNDRLLACPANSSAAPGADSVSDCLCHDNTYFEERQVAHVCIPCRPEQVCRGGVATLCATGAFNVNLRCVCSTGSHCQDPGETSCLSSCLGCPHNHWCTNNNLTACGAHESAPANSSAPCRCLDGFFRNHLGACVQCPLHHVCSNEKRRPVAEFDPGLRTLRPQTAFLSQAVCAQGYFRITKLDMCKLCPVGFYCPPEAAPDAAPTALALPNVVRCPPNEFTALPGASSREQCMCAVGFKLAEDEETAKCLPCAAGERCQGGSVLEVECHLQNKAINDDHSACVCEAGFGLVNFDCHLCHVGFVKPVIGDTPCVPCNIDEFAANSTSCVRCPQHAKARPGSATCSCAPPYAMRDGACTLCPANHFFTLRHDGTGSCVACPLASSSNPSPAMQIGASACRCAPGHEAVPSNFSGILSCRLCPEDYFESDGTCVVCPPGSVAPPGSHSVHACVCNVNATTCYTQRVDRSCTGLCAAPPRPCNACLPGHYKDKPSTQGNVERCLACSEGHYQPAHAALECVACPPNEWHTALAATARSQCLCVGGWARDANVSQGSETGQCIACGAGHYKDWLGNQVCAACPIGSYNPETAATVCKYCSDASVEQLSAALNLAGSSSRPVLESNLTAQVGSVSLLACVCARGHEPRDVGGTLHCSPCASGTFKEHTDHELCAYCGAPNLARGTALLHHFGSPTNGAVTHEHCISCPPFSGQDDGAIGPGLLIMDDAGDCKCWPGHENRSAEGCNACPLYMMQPAFTNDGCAFCPAGHFFVERNALCSACYLADDGGAAHELLVINRIDPGFPWGVDSGDCICRLGYQRDATDMCRACPAGQFRGSNNTRWCAQCPVDTFQDATAAQECNRCPLNSSTLFATGQAAVQGCVCAAGFQQLQHVPSSDAFLCLPCAAGTYRTSRLANESELACVLCPADHYCPAGAVTPTPCPSGELALPGAVEIDQCLCPPGSGRAPGPAHAPDEQSNPCNLCAQAFFAPTRGNTPCGACPANKNTSAAGATALSNCTCIPGHGVAHSTEHTSYDAFLASACTPCQDGFFAPGGRNAPCTHCGWGAVTEPREAASSANSCQCNAHAGLHKTP